MAPVTFALMRPIITYVHKTGVDRTGLTRQ